MTTPDVKAPYHTPQLQEHGTLQELTQAVANPNSKNWDSACGYGDDGTPSYS